MVITINLNVEVEEELNDLEVKVVQNVAERTAKRMAIGRLRYGPLELQGEKATVEYWANELQQEVDDVPTYSSIIDVLKKELGR